jgi:hypothetical protein
MKMDKALTINEALTILENSKLKALTPEQIAKRRERSKARRAAKRVPPVEATMVFKHSILVEHEIKFELKSFRSIIDTFQKGCSDFANYEEGKWYWVTRECWVEVSGKDSYERTLFSFDGHAVEQELKGRYENFESATARKAYALAVGRCGENPKYWKLSPTREYTDDRVVKLSRAIWAEHKDLKRGYDLRFTKSDVRLFNQLLKPSSADIAVASKSVMPMEECLLAQRTEDAKDYSGSTEYSWIDPKDFNKAVSIYVEDLNVKDAYKKAVDKFMETGKPQKIFIGEDYGHVPGSLVPGLKSLYTVWPREGEYGARYQESSSLYLCVGKSRDDFKTN